MADIEPKDVLDFWFAAGKEKWFVKDEAFDAEISTRFKEHHDAAKRWELDSWRETAQGCLALIILLDQFGRNIYRGTADAFAADPKALALARSMVEKSMDMELPVDLRIWIYLPFEHSESMDDQERCIELLERSGMEEFLKWAHLHADVIREFDRFPHRNEALGRTSTPEEIAFLEEGGFSG